ncbi:exonuclease SbcCD subunit D [Nakamurella aerolata]|uniref:Nuclease SbcCD subunit D n=1 Tax=Nakamurella aerolata TaxID=1656892 RepID=A0A849AE95_9ACTN|nr:exonuclease SbcCD subunit D [Nakamurella aerolata]NNG37508.1 exonuclease SbcCD subunit D [Nakamurella aerolata]
MRLLHTSDWHVGRTFHGRDLLEDQRSVLAAIAELVAEHRVDAVLIAGDLYDRAVPSADAIAVLTEAFSAIRAAGAQIVASAGNHDSGPRLGAFSDFLAAGGLHLRADPQRLVEPVLLPDAAAPEVACYPVPYLEPEVVRRRLGLPGPASHQAVMSVALQHIREDFGRRKREHPELHGVAMAHAFVVGASPAGSERSIAVGGVESVGAEVFDGLDYVALGHLHGAQQVSPQLRYSGSPLAYSFNEAGHRKSVTLVELAAGRSMRISELPLPVPRPLVELTGTLQELLAGYGEYTEHYLSARLTDPVRPLEPMRRLQQKFPYAVTLSWQPPEPTAHTVGVDVARAGITDVELVHTFIAECRGSTATATEAGLIDQALALARAGGGE